MPRAKENETQPDRAPATTNDDAAEAAGAAGAAEEEASAKSKASTYNGPPRLCAVLKKQDKFLVNSDDSRYGDLLSAGFVDLRDATAAQLNAFLGDKASGKLAAKRAAVAEACFPHDPERVL